MGVRLPPPAPYFQLPRELRLSGAACREVVAELTLRRGASDPEGDAYTAGPCAASYSLMSSNVRYSHSYSRLGRGRLVTITGATLRHFDSLGKTRAPR